MADKALESAVAEGLEAWETWMAGLNLTPTEEEREAQKRQLYRELGGSELEIPDAGAREVTSWDEVAELLGDPATAGDVLILDDYVKLDDKNQLVNVPFFINRWWFAEGDMGPFAVVRAVASRKVHTGVTGETDKVIVTDGSTGIYSQLRELTKRTGKTGPMMIRHGLRVSQYTAETESGPKQAETFYLT